MGKMTYEDGYKKLMHLFSQFREITRGNNLGMLYFLHIRRFRLIDERVLHMMRDAFHVGAEAEYMRHYWQDCLVSASQYAKERGDATDASVVEEAMMSIEILMHEHSGSQYILFLIVSGLYEIPDEWYDEYYTQLFEELFTKEIESSSSKLFQPKEITELVCRLSGYNGGSVYDPFAGAGSYIFALGTPKQFFAQEISRNRWVLAQMRLRAHNAKTSSFVNGDPITAWNKYPLGIEEQTPSAYDLIISTPPFRLSIKGSLSDFETADELYIYNGLRSLSDTGQLLGVFTHAILYSSNKEAFELRKSFLENDLLDMVVLLPGKLFQETAVDTVVLKFSKAKQHPGQVKFVNATSFYRLKGRDRYLNVDAITDAIDANTEPYVRLIPNEFFLARECRIEPAALFINATSVPDGYKNVEFRSIVREVRGKKVQERDSSDKMITISDLHGDQFKPTIDFDSLGNDENPAHPYYRITEPVLLVSLTRLKTSYVEASEEHPVMVLGSIAAFSVTADWVYIPYLCRQISLLGEDSYHMNKYSGMSMAAMLDLQILFPEDNSDQEIIYKAAESEYKMAKVREYGLEEMLAAQKRDFILILRNRKHDINTYVADIRNRIRGLDKFLRKNGLDKEMYSVRQNKTVGDNMDAIISSIDQMGQYLDHIADESEYGVPVKVDLYKKLSSIEDGQNYTVRFEPDLFSLRDSEDEQGEVNAFIHIAPADLDHVFLNVISNAKKHGFVDPLNTGYCIEISLLYDRETDSYVVEFKNNGKPMSEGLDTSRYGTDGAKFGTTKGEGHGGAIVKETIEHFGGSIEVINAPEKLFPVSIIIKLPRYDGE